MRVINTETYEFEEFWNETDVEYAILSHRWENEEVTFQDFLKIQASPDPDTISSSPLRQKQGFRKIELCCMQARYDQIKYVWIDTCCIDKTSSAELTEAINSMYRWYRHAKICYAFLSDVSYNLVNETTAGSLEASSWFTRGWTLQELVAPRSIVFYDQDWELIGTKHSLGTKISKITGIDEIILYGDNILNRSIAQRMSWASRRTTTRIEDIAYCLLGIFDVNMPLLYGEGTKAFLRLQEKIIQSSDDHTIFAWPHRHHDETGLLAQSPAAFEGCGGVRMVGSRVGKSSYSMTNRGLSIPLYAQPWTTDTYLVALQCVDERLHKSNRSIEQYRMAMFIRRLDEDDQFVRIQEGNKTFVQEQAVLWEPPHIANGFHKTRAVWKIEIKVRQAMLEADSLSLKERIHGFRLRMPEVLDRDKLESGLFTVSNGGFDAVNGILTFPHGAYDAAGTIHIGRQGKKIHVIKLGFDFDCNPVCFMADSRGSRDEKHFRDREGNLGQSRIWQWTTQEQAEFKGIHERSCYDTMAWSTINAGRALQLKHHPGLWAIKADRVHGLSVHLESDGGPTSASLDIRRSAIAGKLIWDVSIIGIKDASSISLKPSLPSRRSSAADVKNSDDESRSTKKGVRLPKIRRKDE